MTQPSVPAFQKEGPAGACVLDGQLLGWKACTCLSTAMGIDKSTINRTVISGCQVRSETGDVIGGTTLEQMYAVAANHGVPTEIHVGANVASLYYLAYQNALGRGFVLQGNTQPDGRGNVNHAVWVNDCYGGPPGNPVGFHVYDPWSNGMAGWSYAKLKAFMLALHPWGESDPRTLKSMGVNGGYALVFPDTEPHFHSHYGGKRASPFPDPLVIHSPVPGKRVRVRTRPDRINDADIVGSLPTGTHWTGYQVTSGAVPPGATGPNKADWWGNHDGNRWIHSSGVTKA
jgi:hypothetical protein